MSSTRSISSGTGGIVVVAQAASCLGGLFHATAATAVVLRIGLLRSAAAVLGWRLVNSMSLSFLALAFRKLIILLTI